MNLDYLYDSSQLVQRALTTDELAHLTSLLRTPVTLLCDDTASSSTLHSFYDPYLNLPT